MLHAGLDLSRRKLEVCLLSEEGAHLDQLAVAPDVDSLRTFARRIDEVHAEPVSAVVESMTGARLVHDTLEQEGWSVEIADAQKVKGLAPLACKTDKIDSMVLAVLSQRDLVPALWLPDPHVREKRELARFRLHLVKHRSMLKQRIHSTLINFGRPCPVTDLFGVEGRRLLERLEVPEPWRGNVTASVALIGDLEHQISAINYRLREDNADHPYIPLLLSAPGIGWVLAFTIAAEIGEIERFSSPQSSPATPAFARASTSRETRIAAAHSQSTAPRYLRWALIEATMHALKHPAYRERYQRNKRRLGKQRGSKVAQIDIARRLAHAIWHMPTRNEKFAPRGAALRLAAWTDPNGLAPASERSNFA
ncbi:MAG TPA: IS110 family transposase [Thermoleophilaceae bacterium]|nr:IS110 family transposase [Thermoleophilaceae bacterium]